MGEMKASYKRNFGKLLLIAFAGSIIYGLPYFRLYYYDAYVEFYHLTNTQMGTLGSAYGVLGLVSYFIGGVLADKFSAKWLMIGSLIATGIGGFAHLFFNDFKILVCIYALWGLTSLLTFWPALLKMVRTLASDEEQSRAYGIFEGGRGVANALHMAAATAIFGFFAAKMMAGAGIRWIIVFYSICPIICGILFIFLLKNPAGTEKKETAKMKLSDIIRVLKMPAVWMMIIITFTTYTFNMSYFYITPYATNILGTSAVLAAVLTVLAQYIRPVASTGGGFLADKFGKSRLMFAGFTAMIIGMLLVILVPKLSGGMQMGTIVLACILVYLAMYSNYGIYFSMQAEGGIPIEVSGIAIGVIATVGYLPEVICPFLAGRTLDSFAGVTGYYYYFTGMIVMAVIGCITCMIWYYKFGKKALADGKKEK